MENKKTKEKDEFIQQLKNLHYEMRTFLDIKDYEGAKTLLEKYTDKKYDINEMHTLLIITKDFKEHSTLKEPRQKLKDLIEIKLGKKLV